jgi:hypothetical protein
LANDRRSATPPERTKSLAAVQIGIKSWYRQGKITLRMHLSMIWHHLKPRRMEMTNSFIAEKTIAGTPDSNTLHLSLIHLMILGSAVLTRSVILA